MKESKSTFIAFKEKATDYVLRKEVALTVTLAASPTLSSFAKSLDDVKDKFDASGKTVSGITWPWTAFLNSLANELTGPLAMVMGILAICVAAFGMFMGNHGAGMQKMLTLIFAIGILLAAPSFISWMKTGADGLTILAGM